MLHMLWEWIVEADAWIGGAALDAALALLGAAALVQSLRSVIACL
jgi:hypothetical protein